MRVSGRGNGKEEWFKKKKKKLNPAVIVAVRGPGRTTAQTKKQAAKKNSKKVKPQPEEPKNVIQFLSRTTEIHKYVKINTVDQISFLARIVR